MRTAQWEITYTLEPGVPYRGGPIEFTDPDLRLTVSEGRITTLWHRICTDPEASREDAERASGEVLDCFLMALRFLQAKPAKWWADGRRLQPPETGPHWVTPPATLVLGPRPVVVPTDGWQTGDAARLSDWLFLASEAQESPSAAIAIRIYYLIIEELVATEAICGDSSELAACLKTIRDFVSHPRIDVDATRERLRRCAQPLSEGPDAFRYRPTSSVQRAVLDDFRMRARTLVDAHLLTKLGLASSFWPTAG